MADIPPYAAFRSFVLRQDGYELSIEFSLKKEYSLQSFFIIVRAGEFVKKDILQTNKICDAICVENHSLKKSCFSSFCFQHLIKYIYFVGVAKDMLGEFLGQCCASVRIIQQIFAAFKNSFR